MKKKNNKKTIPAYAFGMDQLSNYLGGANVFGSAISGLSEEGSTGDVAGSTIGSAASLAGAGLTVGGPIGAAVGGGLGLVSGLIGSIKRKKQMQALRRRKETLNKTKIGMNPHLEYLIEESSKICGHVIVRTNLVILLEKEYEHLMEVYARNKVEVVCSLPYYRAPEMDKVRGAGAFDKAIKVIRRLNAMGYGRNPKLVLNMVYNPAGAFFPPDQEAMEKEYKQKLLQDFGIEFNSLYTLYNNPMGRFGAFLRKSGNLNRYMKKLFDAFNADTVEALMCRTQLSVDYDGQLYDCDFNLAAGMPVNGGQTIFDVTGEPYQVRKIRMDKHCYACTAGAGSS